MKARNHTIHCGSRAQFDALEAEYRWLGEEIETNVATLTITVLALPKNSKRERERAAKLQAKREALEGDYEQRYN